MVIWKTIKCFDMYKISSTGKVWSGHGKGRILKPQKHNGGYEMVTLYKDGRGYITKIHRLVAQHFIPNPKKLPCVCHVDDTPSNNIVSNLFWGSHKDNNVDCVHKGRNPNVGAPKRPVICLDTGEYFESVKDAARSIGVKIPSMSGHLSGRYKTCGGYKWIKL